MIKWSVYEANKDRSHQRRVILGTFELILWLLGSSKDYVVNINKLKSRGTQ